MAINQHYVTTKALEEYLVNRSTGEPLAGGTVEFYKDDDRLIAKTVYQITGAPPNYTFIALPNPITLSAVGTIQNANGDNVALYYLPYTSDEDGADVELYYVVVKDADGNVQFTREGWPNFDEASSFESTEGTIVNELSNSQFIDVLFDPTLGLNIPYTGAGTTEVTFAPDWNIKITHSNSGSVAISRNNIAGTAHTPTNPPYTLTVTPGANITDLKLVQRLNHNPDIWTPTETGVRGFVAGGALLATNTSITMLYVPSSGTSQTIFTANNATGSPAYFSETKQLDPGDNPQTGANGYVDIQLSLSTSNPSTISSVQLVGLESDQSNVSYRQDTVSRQEDQLFHYYNSQLQYKPLPSYLIGWNFPLNPTQFLGASVAAQAVGANKSYYAWDQTIVFQTTDSGVTISRDSSGALKTLSAPVAGTQLALVQYKTGAEIIEMLSRRKCVHVAANASVATSATISLWYTTDVSLPSTIGSNNSIVLTLDSKGYPATRNGTWVEVPRSGLSNASVTTTATNAAEFIIGTSATAEFNQYGFSGWDMEGDADILNATYFAIVVGTASMAQNAYILWQDIACQDGDIPTVSAPLAKSQVLQQCQEYYWMTYPIGTLPGAASSNNARSALMTNSYYENTTPNGIRQVTAATFPIEFPVNMHTAPTTITFYSVAGTSGSVSLLVYAGTSALVAATDTTVSTFWAQADLNTARVNYIGAQSNTYLYNSGAIAINSIPPTGYIKYHAAVDARLGQ